MPCYDSRNDRENVQRETRAESADKINLLTRVACDLSRAMRGAAKLSDLNPETLAWMAAHEKWDKQRKRQDGE